MSAARRSAARKADAETAEPVAAPLRSARALRRKRAPKWVWQTVGIVAVIAVAGYLVWSAVKPSTATTRYVTSTVQRGTLTVSASGNGSVIVGKASSVSPQVSGTVANLDASLGATVTAGQKLFDIVNDQLDDQVTQALAQYRNSQASVIRAQQSVDQAGQQLSQAKLQVTQKQQALDDLEAKEASNPASVTGTQLSIAEQDLAIAKKGVDIAQQGVDAANSSLSASKAGKTSSYNSYQQAIKTADKRVVTAPIGGVITKLNIQDGDSVGGGGSSGGSSSSAASALGASASSSNGGGSSSAAIVISDLSTLQAQVSVSEVDRANVKIGQKATMTFDAVPNLTLTGKVTSIDAVGTNSQGVVTYNVTIAFDALDPRISPGMTAAAAITTDVRTNVLTVPRSAVKSSSDGGSYVLVMPSGATTPQQATVEAGVSTDSSTEIVSGLKEGDAVVTQSIAPNSTGTSGSSGGSGNRTGFGAMGGMGGGVRVMRGD